MIQYWTVLFIYNICNNYIINNKSDEIEILKIRMAVARYKDATASDVFTFFFFTYQFKKKTERRQWEWRFPTGVKLI
jgi:hypothetical protein